MRVPVVGRHPFTTWALVALVLHVCIIRLRLDYDDGGLGSILILSSSLWGFMYWLPHELLFALNRGHSFPGHWLAAVIIGLLLCFAADLVVRRLRRRKGPSAGTGAGDLLL